MSTASQPSFNWQIHEESLWPPKGRPKAPFGPTSIEIIRSCALRSCFECSKGYERRTAYSARVGIAFHRALQSLTEHAIIASNKNEVIYEATRRFYHELTLQEAQKATHPREQMLARNEERIRRAEESVTIEALRLAASFSEKHHFLKPNNHVLDASQRSAMPLSQNEHKKLIMVEIPVNSQDGLLTGRVDYAERNIHGDVHLIDYKSALRDDVPERYERQLQLYTLLWYETFGEWPVEAHIVYPFTGTIHAVTINATMCQRIGNEARLIAQTLQTGLNADQLASPSKGCTMCEFRPWCQPFWKWQANHSNHSEALTDATYGFEGKILRIEVKSLHWIVIVQWRDAEIRLVAPQERFPHLKDATSGMRLRGLDIRLHGLRYRPQAVISEKSEIFLLT